MALGGESLVIDHLVVCATVDDADLVEDRLARSPI